METLLRKARELDVRLNMYDDALFPDVADADPWAGRDNANSGLGLRTSLPRQPRLQKLRKTGNCAP